MANDHYISRFLTKPWEVGQRRLHYYDIDKGKFDECSSESLFALDGLHSEKTGQVLNEFIETPVSRYRTEILRSGDKMPPLTDPKLYRALASLIILQVQREMDARKPGELKFSLDDLAAQGEGLVHAIASIAYKDSELIAVVLHQNAAPLFFTEAVYFVIPMIGTAPIMAVPLTPRHFVALPEKGFSERQLNEMLNDRMRLSAFSLGFGPWTRRVVIPPEALAARDSDPRAFEAMIREQQVRCRKVFNLIGKMTHIAGLASFVVKEHYEEDVAEVEPLAAEAVPGPDDEEDSRE
jgi:hypothetical protein